jgi:hypothetical protein
MSRQRRFADASHTDRTVNPHNFCFSLFSDSAYRWNEIGAANPVCFSGNVRTVSSRRRPCHILDL